MKQHPPYTEADWLADCERKAQRELLTCRDCGFSGDYNGYGPRGREAVMRFLTEACQLRLVGQLPADLPHFVEAAPVPSG